MDLFLWQRYKASLFLIDKSCLDKGFNRRFPFGFASRGLFYHSFPITLKFLRLNGVTSSINTQEATDDNKILFDEKFDLIISLLCWGFHFPISTYLDEVYNKLNDGGTVIIDIRKDTEGERGFEKVFGNYSVISDDKRHVRILAKK